MELCANRSPSNVQPSPYSRLPQAPVNRRFTPSVHLKQTVSPLRRKSGDVSRKPSSLRASMSEDTPSEMSKFDGETRSRIVAVEDLPPAEKNMFNNSAQEETRQDESPSDEQMQPFGELLDKFSLKESLNIRLDESSAFMPCLSGYLSNASFVLSMMDTDDSYSFLLYGGGALISVWLLSAIVGAIDSIPLFPKFLEVVGLSYSLWFTTRYLIFKENRDELGAKIEELKQQVLGSNED